MKKILSLILATMLLCGCALSSASVSADSTSDEAPLPAVNIDMEASHMLFLSWNEVEDAAYYELELTDSEGAVLNVSELKVTEFEWDPDGEHTEFEVCLTAYNESGVAIAHGHTEPVYLFVSGLWDWFGVVGDADDDWDINIKDATLVQKHVAQLTQLEGFQFRTADADGDSEITVKDATEIQRHCAEFETEYVGQGIGDGGRLYGIMAKQEQPTTYINE